MSRDELDYIAANGALVGLDAGAANDAGSGPRGPSSSTLFTNRMLSAIYIGSTASPR